MIINPVEREEIKKKFLHELGKQTVAGNVSVAVHNIKVSRSSVYSYRKEDPQFALQWDTVVEEAHEELADEFENALRKSAVDKLNPTSIIFGLKNLRPTKWKDRMQHEGIGGGAIKHVHKLSPQLKQVLSKIEKKDEQ